VDRLRSDPALSQLYAVEVQNRFSALSVQDSDDIETSCGKLSSAITEAAAHIVGTKRNIKQPWMTNDTFEILLSKATARDQVEERRRLQGVFNARQSLIRRTTLTDSLMKLRRVSDTTTHVSRTVLSSVSQEIKEI
jgi:hypothetical protein